MTRYDPITLGILWDRLISIADEIVAALVRTSFSTIVRESYDLSCVLFDAQGRSIVQGTYSLPSFTGTAPATLRHMLARFPRETLRPGDVIATNDPWLGTGHLFDVNVVQPVFVGGRIVGYAMSISHLPDIGGVGFSTSAREIYEEGLRFLPVKLVDAGRPNELLLELIQTNVRVPSQTLGDLMANVSATTVGARMLVEFMEEYRIDDLTALADAILAFSESAIRQEIRRMPEGTYANAIDIEGYDVPLRLACKITLAEGEATVDFAGSSLAIPAAINVPFCYSQAMACYAIKCLTTPRTPNNEGSVRPIKVSAPPGSILNAMPPSPTGGRHMVGHFVNPLMFGALARAAPQRIQADSGMMNLINVQGRTRDGRPISSIFFASGGFGALHGLDGAPTTPSPSNMMGTPVEIWENLMGMTVTRKSLLPDSGGAGEFRGGVGQRLELRNDSGHPMTISCLAVRTAFAPQGVHGGAAGRLREMLINGAPVHPQGRHVLLPGDVLTTLEAGGGGYGDPSKRPRDSVLADVAAGYVTVDGARRDYGVETG
jgi:N-methylhydantoinase B